MSDSQILQKKNQLKDLAQLAFSKADVDGSGSIDVDELMTIVTQMAGQLEVTPPSLQEVQDLIKIFDDNGDGVLQLEEFQNFVGSLFGEEPMTDDEDNNNENDDVLEETQQENKKVEKEERVRRASLLKENNGFLNSILNRKLNLQDSNVMDILQVSRKYTKFSVELFEIQKKLELDLQKQCQQEKDNQIKQQQSPIIHDLRRQSDSKYMNNFKKESKGSICTIYTDMTPTKSNQGSPNLKNKGISFSDQFQTLIKSNSKLYNQRLSGDKSPSGCGSPSLYKASSILKQYTTSSVQNSPKNNKNYRKLDSIEIKDNTEDLLEQIKQFQLQNGKNKKKKSLYDDIVL